MADVFDFSDGAHQHCSADPANSDEIGLKRSVLIGIWDQMELGTIREKIAIREKIGMKP
jgi:hypothetical protein